RSAHMRILLCALVTAALALSACGESKEDKAMKSVCNARADISKQIDHLKTLTPTTATIEGVQSSLTSIGKDLSTIKDAQGDLSGDRKAQVQKAAEQFSSQVQSITSQAVKSLSLSDAATQLTAALQQLASAFQQTLKPIDCS